MATSSSHHDSMGEVINIMGYALERLVDLDHIDALDRSFILRLLRREPSAIQASRNANPYSKNDGSVGAVADNHSHYAKLQDNPHRPLYPSQQAIPAKYADPVLSEEQKLELFRKRASSRNVKLSVPEQSTISTHHTSPFKPTPVPRTISHGENISSPLYTFTKNDNLPEKSIVPLQDTTVPLQDTKDPLKVPSDKDTNNTINNGNVVTPHDITAHSQDKNVPDQSNTNAKPSSKTKVSAMMAKMGFKEGQGLGKAKDGIREPVKTNWKVCKSGLGYVEADDRWGEHVLGQKDYDALRISNEALDPELLWQFSHVPDRRPIKRKKNKRLQQLEEPETEVFKEYKPEETRGNKPEKRYSSIGVRFVTDGTGPGCVFITTKILGVSGEVKCTKLTVGAVVEALSQQYVRSSSSVWIMVNVSDKLEMVRSMGNGIFIVKNLSAMKVEGRVRIDHMEKSADPEMTHAPPPPAVEKRSTEGLEDAIAKWGAHFPPHVEAKYGPSPLADALPKSFAAFNELSKQPKLEAAIVRKKCTEVYSVDTSNLKPVTESEESKRFWAGVQTRLPHQTKINPWQEYVRGNLHSSSSLASPQIPDSLGSIEDGNRAEPTTGTNTVSTEPPVIAITTHDTLTTANMISSEEKSETPAFAKESEKKKTKSIMITAKLGTDAPKHEPVRRGSWTQVLKPVEPSIPIVQDPEVKRFWEQHEKLMKSRSPSPLDKHRPEMKSLPSSRSSSPPSNTEPSSNNPFSQTPSAAKSPKAEPPHIKQMVSSMYVLPHKKSDCSPISSANTRASSVSKTCSVIKITGYSPRALNENWFRRHFEVFGKIESVKKFEGASNKSDYGVDISYADLECAMAAVNAAGSEIGGCKMSVLLV